jgi:hypothetical protein
VPFPRLASAAAACLLAVQLHAQGTNEAGTWIRQIATTDADVHAIPFGFVIESVTGHRVLAFDPTNAVDAEVSRRVGEALDRVLRQMNGTNSPLRSVKRINEASRFFETAIREELNTFDGITCTVPMTEEGRTQRSGYPDLRLVHRSSGRVFFLDPKLRGPKARASSLRTFYYEPRFATNKVLDDAVHLLVGIEHDGAAAGQWTFTRWELVDLSSLKLELKAEFQASNRDLYQPATIVGQSPEPDENKTGAPLPERP